ncbi:RagB/SusD family nutrient uptake outer membrane protein [Flammeovirgaceae bacterium SG7u.111]|nr:RagB/SusD family nutrient uptake outer membrane protein [Flammeovirgaceae bacterium SG7u.132]WPO38425.1 RagB/SusD family nutrient uptake outer membrane protein [Flammeovirgaceae bacterium SG7u.111]
MKYLFKYILTLFLSLFILGSCSNDFLDEVVEDQYAPETLRDELGFEAAATGLYNHFSTMYTRTDDQTLLGVFQLGTDITWAPSGRSNGDARPYFDYTTLTSTDWASKKIWIYLYKMINNANILIENAEGGDAQITAEQSKMYSAEGKFFRAYAYNMLATLYGDVPLLSEPVKSARTDFVRNPISEVNSLIVEDLLYAAQNLPTIDDTKYEARANQSMARQLLGEAYLRTDEPALAEAQLSAIINSGRFSLVNSRYGVHAGDPGDPFSDMFYVGNLRRSQGNSEAIWVLEQENPTDVPGGSTGAPQQRRVWGGSYHDIPGMVPADSLGGRGLARIRLNDWVLYGLYEDGDMRNSQYTIKRQHYFNNPGENYDPIRGLPVPYAQNAEFTLADGSTINIFEADSVYKYAPYTLKWKQFDDRDTFGWGQWKDFMIMRLGETYLLRAEARFKQGNASGAADDINMLRNRANTSTVNASDISLDFILDERARELVGEENRRMTLVRTGTLVERAKRLNGTAPRADGNIETTNGLQDFHMLMPIPQDEIDLNKDAVLEQNPGYN